MMNNTLTDFITNINNGLYTTEELYSELTKLDMIAYNSLQQLLYVVGQERDDSIYEYEEKFE